jgi:hypothetical protein
MRPYQNKNYPTPASNLQLRLLHPLEQNIAIRVRIDSNLVKRVELTCPVEHIFIHLSILPSQRTVQHPIIEAPAIHEPNSMRPNLLEQLHNRLRPRELNLQFTARSRGVEFTSFLLERVQRKQAEQLHQDVENVLVDFALGFDLLERG